MFTLKFKKSSSLGICVLIVLFASLACVLLSLHSAQYISNNWISLRYITRRKFPMHTHCVVYDKAPRTGSSTISSTIKTCLRTQKFSFPKITQGVRMEGQVSNMLNSTAKRVVFTGMHLRMPPSEIIQLKLSCYSLFYLTSTRPMAERIMSIAKYKASGAITSKNTSLSSKNLTDAWKYAVELINERKAEVELERYPFEEWKLTPDYIIRSERFKEDIHDLLGAFNCSKQFVSKNIHFVDKNHTESMNVSHGTNRTEDLELWKLKFGDARHKKLTAFAKYQNPNGLLKAMHFRIG